jgi:hypothetical protein
MQLQVTNSSQLFSKRKTLKDRSMTVPATWLSVSCLIRCTSRSCTRGPVKEARTSFRSTEFAELESSGATQDGVGCVETRKVSARSNGFRFRCSSNISRCPSTGTIRTRLGKSVFLNFCGCSIS